MITLTKSCGIGSAEAANAARLPASPEIKSTIPNVFLPLVNPGWQPLNPHFGTETNFFAKRSFHISNLQQKCWDTVPNSSAGCLEAKKSSTPEMLEQTPNASSHLFRPNST